MAASMPAAASRCGEALVAHVVHRVVVGHHRDRDAGVEVGQLVDDRRRRRADVERALRCLLDRAAVHHRIRERDADLDRVGARRRRRRARRRASRARARRSRTARAACDPRPAAPAACASSVHAIASPVSISATCIASLSPAPRQRDQHRRALRDRVARPRGRASRSRAPARAPGTMPSVTDRSWKPVERLGVGRGLVLGAALRPRAPRARARRRGSRARR